MYTNTHVFERWWNRFHTGSPHPKSLIGPFALSGVCVARLTWMSRLFLCLPMDPFTFSLVPRTWLWSPVSFCYVSIIAMFTRLVNWSAIDVQAEIPQQAGLFDFVQIFTGLLPGGWPWWPPDHCHGIQDIHITHRITCVIYFISSCATIRSTLFVLDQIPSNEWQSQLCVQC